MAAAPDDVRTGLELLQEWIRAAVTQADGGTESLLHSALSCVPTQAETAQALERWYYDLVEIHAPVVSAGTPSGGSVGGGGSRPAVPPPPNPTDATVICAPRFTTYYDDERIILTWSRSTLRWSRPVRLAMVRLAGAEADQPSLRLRTRLMRLQQALHAPRFTTYYDDERITLCAALARSRAARRRRRRKEIEAEVRRLRRQAEAAASTGPSRDSAETQTPPAPQAPPTKTWLGASSQHAYTIWSANSANNSCKVQAGEPWPDELIQASRAAGPHVSALTDDSFKLIWEDISYQVAAGFVRVVSAAIPPRA